VTSHMPIEAARQPDADAVVVWVRDAGNTMLPGKSGLARAFLPSLPLADTGAAPTCCMQAADASRGVVTSPRHARLITKAATRGRG